MQGEFSWKMLVFISFNIVSIIAPSVGNLFCNVDLHKSILLQHYLIP